MMYNYIMFAIMAVVLLPALTTGESEVCCSSRVMDSDGRTVLEKGTPVTPIGTAFNIIKAKFCLATPVYIQLWRPSNREPSPSYPGTLSQPVAYELIWQLHYKPPDGLQFEEWVEIRLDTPMGLDPEDRLGLQAPEGWKMPISYTVSAGSPLYASQSRGTPGQEQAMGTTLSFDSMPYPWSYNTNVKFCYETDTAGRSDCINGDSPALVVVAGPPGVAGAPGHPGTVGPAGPPGPAGEACTGQGPPITCSADPVLMDRLYQLEGATNTLINQLGGINTVINEQMLTGSCPDGFIPGTYGIGYCYLIVHAPPTAPMQFGNYAFWCYSQHRSMPLFIEAEIEESFIVSHVMAILSEKYPSSQNLTLGTAGLYSELPDTHKQAWVWYSENTAPRLPFHYTNWAVGEPRLHSQPEIQECMRLVVQRDKTHNWYSQDCRQPVPFICKKPKNCY